MAHATILLPLVVLATSLPGTGVTGDPYAELKRTYLACESSALSEHMPSSDVAGCSQAYEDLKAGAFDGDWTKLRDWSTQELEIQRALTDNE